jgi:hypothetical protein
VVMQEITSGVATIISIQVVDVIIAGMESFFSCS